MGIVELSFKEADEWFRDWLENCVDEIDQQNGLDGYMTALDAMVRELNWKGLDLIEESNKEEQD